MTGTAAAGAITVLRLAPDGTAQPVDRALATETPISIEYNGIGYAVMMASPSDLEDFAIGFSLSEGLIAAGSEIIGIDATQLANGWVLRVELPAERTARIMDRARLRVAEGSCGLCGLENLEQVMRPLPILEARPQADAAAIFAALGALSGHQPLSGLTGAVHAAAFCSPDGAVLLAREDVGRHNALDKLIGALASSGLSPASGFILLSARCSYELVEKTVLAGCPMLVTISAPTSLAVERAKAHHLTLVALARSDAALVASDPWGLFSP